jgi:hypothetical protein
VENASPKAAEMRLLDRYIWICQLACVTFFSVGFVLIGFSWQVVIGVIILLGLFIAGVQFNLKRMPSFLLFIAFIFAATGCYIGVHPYWMLLGLTASLASWDLQGFKEKFDHFERIENSTEIESGHIKYLGLVLFSGILIGAISLTIRIQIPFGIIILLGTIVIVAIFQVFRYIRKSER